MAYNMDWIIEEESGEIQRQEDEKRLKELDFFLDCQIELAEILDGGYSIFKDYKFNEKKELVFDRWHAVGDTETGEQLNGYGATFKEAVLDLYYTLMEWQEQQEDEPKTISLDEFWDEVHKNGGAKEIHF